MEVWEGLTGNQSIYVIMMFKVIIMMTPFPIARQMLAVNGGLLVMTRDAYYDYDFDHGVHHHDDGSLPYARQILAGNGGPLLMACPQPDDVIYIPPLYSLLKNITIAFILLKIWLFLKQNLGEIQRSI